MPIFHNIVIPLMLVYLALNFIMHFYAADKLIFLPPPSAYSETDKDVIKISDGSKTIGAYYLPNKNSKYTILFSHGNAEDIRHMRAYLLHLHALGFNVMAYDYFGYGISHKKPSEKNAYRAANMALNFLKSEKNVTPENIILFGRSLGTGVSMELATHNKFAGIILESPFLSAYRVVTGVRLMLFDKFNNVAKINKINNIPMLMISAKQDAIVPFWHGEKLYQKYQGEKQRLTLANAGHNDILFVAGKDYDKAIIDFVSTLK